MYASVLEGDVQKFSISLEEVSNILLVSNSTLHFREMLWLGYVRVDPYFETCVYLLSDFPTGGEVPSCTLSQGVKDLGAGLVQCSAFGHLLYYVPLHPLKVAQFGY